MLTGDNGIITQANNAKVANEKATAKEKVQVEVGGSRGTDGKLDYELLKDNLQNVQGIENAPDSIEAEDFPLEVTVDGYKVKITDNGTVTVEGETTGGTGDGVITISSLDEIKGKYYEKDTTISIGEQTIAIPGGATVSGITEECKTIDDGLVIYITNGATITDWTDTETIQKKYDQFVWVPVKNPVLDLSANTTALESEINIKNAVRAEIAAGRYPMAIKKSEEEYFGVLYQFTEEGGTVKIEPYSNWTPLSPYFVAKEPNNIVNDIDLQVEFRMMIEKVSQNKGFWVGRYETSKMNTDTVAVVKNTIDGISDVDWYKMHESQKTYKISELTNSTKTMSGMIWGSQWDQIMIWMKDVKNGENYYITNSIGMGNFGDLELETGKEGYDIKNIYDLAGNVCEWTFECKGYEDLTLRGGYYGYDNSFYTRADDRNFSASPTTSRSNYGSRLTLY